MNMTGLLERSPLQEIAKRTAEAGGGLAAAVKAAAVQNYVANQNAYRKRLYDGHAAGMKALGFEASKQDEDSDVGNIIVTGDIYSDDAVRALRDMTQANPNSQDIQGSQSSGNTTATQNQDSFLSKFAPLALASLIGVGAGTGIPWYLGAYENKEPVVQEFDDTASNVEAVQIWKPQVENNDG